MRTLLVSSFLAVTGCGLYLDEAPPPEPAIATYQLVPRGNVAPLGDVYAVAWDGSRHWIVTREAEGDYWAPHRIEVFSFDVATGTASPPIVLTEHWERPTGATWIHGKLWIHYDANSAGLVTALDTATGVETPQFSVGGLMGDIDSDGTSLYLADYTVNSLIEQRDLVSGEITDVMWNQAFSGSLRGLGVVTGPGAAAPEVWAGTWTNELTILVDNVRVARAVFDNVFPATNISPLLQFTGQGLTVVAYNQLYFYDVVRPVAP